MNKCFLRTPSIRINTTAIRIDIHNTLSCPHNVNVYKDVFLHEAAKEPWLRLVRAVLTSLSERKPSSSEAYNRVINCAYELIMYAILKQCALPMLCLALVTLIDTDVQNFKLQTRFLSPHLPFNFE